MISSLELKNFRRHAHTVLTFTPDEQLIVVSGDNGAGKSTLVSEALLFAFYGESRHGRRRLDELVRRGSELEGVEVSVTFTLANHTWKVARRRVEGIGSATLSMDGDVVASGSAPVDAQMVALLGMDAAGFRLAVLARQKELDGLTSLDKSTRRKVLGRLLRIDAVAKAAASAADRYNRAAEVLAAFPPRTDMDALDAHIEALEAAHVAAVEEFAAAAAAVDDAEQRAAESAKLDATARQAEAEFAAAAAAAAEARTAASDATQRAEQLAREAEQMTCPPAPEVPSQMLAERRVELTEELTSARATKKLHEDRVVLLQDLTDARAELDAVRTELAALADVDAELDAAKETARAARAAASEARDVLAAARDAQAAAAETVRAAKERLDELAEVGVGTCERCGTELDAEHLEAHRVELTERVGAAEQVLAERVAKVAELQEAFDAADTLFEQTREAGREVTAKVQNRDALLTRADTHERRVKVLELRANADLPDLVDIDELESRLAATVTALEEARAAEECVAARDRKREEAAQAAQAAHTAATRAETLDAASAASAVPEELLDAKETHRKRTAELVAARERRADAKERRAVTEAEVVAAKRSRDEHVEAAERRASRELAARHAAFTKQVLRDCHEVLSAGLRPALESSATQLLARLSEGRFPAVKVTGDYDVLISDDGEFRSLGELSGGETDLVALALRLALAQVVADRRGSDALGLLVLDEVFGSQDAQRRNTILVALRELRQIYGQIFLISHVGGLEDGADRVVDIALDEDRVAYATDG